MGREKLSREKKTSPCLLLGVTSSMLACREMGHRCTAAEHALPKSHLIPCVVEGVMSVRLALCKTFASLHTWSRCHLLLVLRVQLLIFSYTRLYWAGCCKLFVLTEIILLTSISSGILLGITFWVIRSWNWSSHEWHLCFKTQPATKNSGLIHSVKTE